MEAKNVSDLIGREISVNDFMLLKNVIIADGVENIYDFAFYYHHNLLSIVIPNTVKRIGENAFDNSPLTSIVIPKSVESIGDHAFYSCRNLSKAIIQGDVKSISEYAFAFCENLTEIIIQGNVKSIGKNAFFNCGKLTKVTLPNSIMNIEDGAFYGCRRLSSINIPTGMKTIGMRAFSRCGIISADIPEGVISIDDWAFEDCQRLSSIRIPDSVQQISETAFDYCNGVESIIISQNNKVFDSRNNCNAIVRSKDNTIIYVCRKSTIPKGIKKIDYHACRHCVGISSLALPQHFGNIATNTSSYIENSKKSPDDKMIITISHLGYIERTSLTEICFLTQGDNENKAFYTRDNDFVEYASLATMQSSILFFTSLGLCYWLKVNDIPESHNNQSEYNVQNLLKLNAGDCIKAFICVEDYTNVHFLRSHYIVFCTKQGRVKKTSLMDYFRCRNGIIRPCRNGIIAYGLNEDDSLVNAVVTNGKNDLMLANRVGNAIRFNESMILVMGRNSYGVNGMNLKHESDEIVGIVHINDVKSDSVMFVCENGYGIRTNLDDYRITNRGNFGVKTMDVKNETPQIVAITTVNDDSDLIIFNKSGAIKRIKMRNVPIKGRASRSIKLIDMLPKNDQIICALRVDDFDTLKED